MKIKNIIYAAMIIFSIAACKKNDLLNQVPPTQLTDAAYWHTPSDLVNYVNNFYSNSNIFNNNPSLTGIYNLDDASDNLVPNIPNARLAGQLTVAGSSTYADWSSIRNVNYFFANYKRVSGSANDINSSVGEAYFFRAILYFNGLRAVGGLPWINKPLDINDTQLLNAPRLPRNELVDSIVSDIDKAIALLPAKSALSSNTPLRVYKEFAEGYKSRICLFEGTWEKYHAGDAFGVPGQNGAAFLQEAADAAQAVINSGTFSLDNVGVPSGYFNLFNQLDYSGSKEIMFWGAYNIQAKIYTYWQNYFQLGSEDANLSGLSKSLVDDYLCVDGKPASISPLYKGDDSLRHVVQNRDPRLRQTIFNYGDTVVTNQPGNNPILLFTYPALNTNYPCTTGYQLKKGLNYDIHLQNYGGNGIGDTQGLIYMRYAEILLNLAEAKAELGTITQSDVDATINLLRDRVHIAHLNIGAITTDPNWHFPALSPIINEVRRERRIELACEGFRFDDILRWAAAPVFIAHKIPEGAAVKQFLTVPLFAGPLVINQNVFVDSKGYILPYGANSAMARGYNFDVSRDYLLPIPLSETVINPAIKQNPGWQ